MASKTVLETVEAMILEFSRKIRRLGYYETTKFLEDVQKETDWNLNVVTDYDGYIDSIRGPSFAIKKIITLFAELLQCERFSSLTASDQENGSSEKDYWCKIICEVSQACVLNERGVCPLPDKTNDDTSDHYIMKLYADDSSDSQFRQNDPSKILTMDVNVLSYLLSEYRSEVHAIRVKHSCSMKNSFEIIHQQKYFLFTLCSNFSRPLSKIDLQAATDSFAQLYRKVASEVTVQVLALPYDIDNALIDMELKKYQAKLIKRSDFCYLVCPATKLQRIRQGIETILRKFYDNKLSLPIEVACCMIRTFLYSHRVEMEHGFVVQIQSGDLFAQDVSALIIPDWIEGMEQAANEWRNRRTEDGLAAHVLLLSFGDSANNVLCQNSFVRFSKALVQSIVLADSVKAESIAIPAFKTGDVVLYFDIEI